MAGSLLLTFLLKVADERRRRMCHKATGEAEENVSQGNRRGGGECVKRQQERRRRMCHNATGEARGMCHKATGEARRMCHNATG